MGRTWGNTFDVIWQSLLKYVIHPRRPTFQIILNKIIQDIEDESCPRLL